MRDQIGIFKLPVLRQINGIRQHQVIDLIFDLHELGKRDLAALDGQVDVGAGAVVAFGA